jgi:iron-sulfur cluster insertion protein
VALLNQAQKPNSQLEARGIQAYLSFMSMILTESAAARVSAIAAKQGKPAILRLSVEGGGCSGFQYKFGLADEVDVEDSVATEGGVQLVVDAMSLDLIDGSAVDYVESLGGSAFRVTNPNAASGCGCGSSFSV